MMLGARRLDGGVLLLAILLCLFVPRADGSGMGLASFWCEMSLGG